MAEKPKPPVPERRFLSTRPGAAKRAIGSKRGGKKKPPLPSTDPSPKR